MTTLTTPDPMTLPHVAALCAAVDEGDDAVLPILADALEEAGDPRAAGLRLVGDRRPLPGTGLDPGFWWHCATKYHGEDQPERVGEAIYSRLPLARRQAGGVAKEYAGRGTALLALAEALTA